MAGATGAHLDSSIVIILGFANLIADGFAMSVGSYLSSKSTKQQYEKHRQTEYWEIKHLRETEVEEIRDIFRKKGFEGDLLEQVVAKITEDEDRWVDVMMKDELMMTAEERPSFAIGAVTYASFLAVGFIPLLAYVVDYFSPLGINLFLPASALTLLAFAGIGVLKSVVTQTSRLRSITETMLLGIIAAVLAYTAGDVLGKMFG